MDPAKPYKLRLPQHLWLSLALLAHLTLLFTSLGMGGQNNFSFAEDITFVPTTRLTYYLSEHILITIVDMILMWLFMNHDSYLAFVQSSTYSL